MYDTHTCVRHDAAFVPSPPHLYSLQIPRQKSSIIVIKVLPFVTAAWKRPHFTRHSTVLLANRSTLTTFRSLVCVYMCVTFSPKKRVHRRFTGLLSSAKTNNDFLHGIPHEIWWRISTPLSLIILNNAFNITNDKYIKI